MEVSAAVKRSMVIRRRKQNAAASIDDAHTGRVFPVTAAAVNTSYDHRKIRLEP